MRADEFKIMLYIFAYFAIPASLMVLAVIGVWIGRSLSRLVAMQEETLRLLRKSGSDMSSLTE